MIWILWVVIAVAIVVGLKLFFKTMKLVSVLVVLALLVGAFLLWRGGINLPLK